MEDVSYLQEVQQALEVQHPPAEGQESILFTHENILIHVSPADLP